MKILYHHRTLGDGAEGIHISEMVNAFRKLEHQVRVVSPIGGQTNVINKRVTQFARLKKMVPPVTYELLELGYNAYGYFLLCNAIREFRPDLIYDRYITFNASSIFAGRWFNIPVFLEVNAPLALERQREADEKLYLNRLAHRIEAWICAHANKTIVVSTPLKDYLISVGVPNANLVVVPNGVNLDKFQPRPKDMSLLYELGIPSERIIFGFVGILRAWHGLELLIDAFSEISDSVDGHLIFIGDGPVRLEIERKIRQLGLENRVTITGRVVHECISRYISVVDIAISPKATFYASPMKIMEYMALKKAVIAPDMPNIHDIIVDYEDGLLFKSGGTEALSKAMLELAANPEFRGYLARNARKKVENNLNWIKNAKLILSLAQ